MTDDIADQTALDLARTDDLKQILGAYEDKVSAHSLQSPVLF